MNSRRSFIKQASIFTAGALFMKQSMATMKPATKIGIQLYTLRNEITKDVKTVTKQISLAGYQHVETYGYSKDNGFWGLSAKEYLKLLGDNNVSSPAGHYDLHGYLALKDDKDLLTYIEAANTLGQNYLIIPFIDNALLKTTESCKQIAERINNIGVICKRNGLTIAYHNHSFEWANIEKTNFYEILLKYTDADIVKMEMDIYWVVKAGRDPITLLRDNPNRFKLVHVKDMDSRNRELNTEVGSGLIDFRPILHAANKSGVQNFIIEQENFTKDPFLSIKESLEYTKVLL